MGSTNELIEDFYFLMAVIIKGVITNHQDLIPLDLDMFRKKVLPH